MLNFTTLLKSFITEIQIELGMRRKVWKQVPEHDHKFTDFTHQSRYDAMRLMSKVYEEMTTRELEVIVNRINKKKELAKSQKSLFERPADA